MSKTLSSGNMLAIPKRRVAATSAAVAVIATLFIGCAAAAHSPRTPKAVWLSPGGDDATCRRGQQDNPCGTPARAWSLALAGDRIDVAPGDYTTGCSLRGAKSTSTFFVGTQAARFICSLVPPTGAAHLVVSGVQLYQVGTAGPTSYITVANTQLTCTDAAPYALYPPGNKCDAHFSLGQAGHVTFTNVSIGPTYDSSACGGEQTNIAPGLTNSTFSHVTFHDARWQRLCANGGTNSQHTENFYLSGVNNPISNVTFDSCRFTNGPNSGGVSGTDAADGTGPNSAKLFLTGPMDGLHVRNCIFDGAGGTGIDGAVDSVLTHSDFTNNTLPSGMYFQCDRAHCPSGYPTTVQFINNISANQSCPIGPELGSSGGYFRNNLWYFNNTGGHADQCNPSDMTLNGVGVVQQLFANYQAGDYRLKSGSPAVGRADPDVHTVRDFAGVCRPQGRRPDIGAFELPNLGRTRHAPSARGGGCARS